MTAHPRPSQALMPAMPGHQTPEQALASVNRLLDQQAYTMAVTDVFYLSSVLFFALLALLWAAKPKPGAGAGGGGAH